MSAQSSEVDKREAEVSAKTEVDKSEADASTKTEVDESEAEISATSEAGTSEAGKSEAEVSTKSETETEGGVGNFVATDDVGGAGSGTGSGEADDADTEGNAAPFQINDWCAKCWPEFRSQKNAPLESCVRAGHTFGPNDERVTTILWPPAAGGQPQTHVVVRPPPADFDFSHMQYLPCGYGRECKHGRKCTRAHSNPPQAEIAYWNYLQPLGPPSRRRRAANERRTTAKEWTSNIVYECHICGVRMNSKAQLVQHESGNKHRAQVAATQGLARAAGLKSRMGAGGASSDVESVPNRALPHGTGPYYNAAGTGWASASADDDAVAMSDSAVGYGGRGLGRQSKPSAARTRGARYNMRVAELEIPDHSESSPDETEADDHSNGQKAPATRTQYALQQSYLTAVKSGDTGLVAKLIMDGAAVDARDAGCPALQWAIFMGHVDTALYIISAGAKRDLVDLDMQTAIHICLHPRHGMMKHVLGDSSATGGKRFKQCEQNTLCVLTALLEAGWSPDVRDRRGRSGLHHVAEQGNITLALVLIKYHANPKILNKEGWSPTDVATLKAKTEGLPKYVQLRDLLLNAAYNSGSAVSPMSIPVEGRESPVQIRLVQGSTPIEEMNSMALSTSMPGSGVAGAAVSGSGTGQLAVPDDDDQYHDQYTEVDPVFRPLMAALCSFSGNWEHYANQGVELSQLALRLRPVIDNIPGGLKCNTYVTHARDRGLVVIRPSANGKQHYVSIAPKYSHLLAQPMAQAVTSNPYFGKMNSLSSAWSSPDISALRSGVGNLPRSGLKTNSSASTPMSSYEPSEPAEPTLIESDFSAPDQGQSPLDYEAMLNGVIGQDDADEGKLIKQINESFNTDPFSHSLEPLFPQKLPPISGPNLSLRDPWGVPGSSGSSKISPSGSSEWRNAISGAAGGESPTGNNGSGTNGGTQTSTMSGLRMEPMHLAWASAGGNNSNQSKEPDATLS